MAPAAPTFLHKPARATRPGTQRPGRANRALGRGDELIRLQLAGVCFSGHPTTGDVSRYEIQTASGTIDIVFNRRPQVYPHRQARVRIARDPAQVALAEGARVEVRGDIWESANRSGSGPR